MKKIIIFIVILIALGIANAQINVGSVNNDWHVTGNVARTTDYLGTKNNVDLTFKAGSDTKLILYTNDSVRIPNLTNKPFLQLDANGYLTNANTGQTNGYFWGLKGNTGTNANVNYLGTTDQNDIVVKYANFEVARFSNPALNFTSRFLKVGFMQSTSNAAFVVRTDFYKIASFGTSDNQTFEILKSYPNGSQLATNSQTFLTGYVDGTGAPKTIIGNPATGSGTQIVPNNTLLINSEFTNKSGLSFYYLNNASPTTQNAQPIGVTSTGEVVTVANAVTVNNTAVNTTSTQNVLGNQSFPTAGTGIILKSPNGTKYLITVNDDGTLKSQKIN